MCSRQEEQEKEETIEKKKEEATKCLGSCYSVVVVVVQCSLKHR